jgi:ABC-2 type transport system permease protein
MSRVVAVWAAAWSAEWTKLWSVWSTWWGLAAMAGLIVTCSATVGADMMQQLTRAEVPGASLSMAEPVLTAAAFALFAVAALGTLPITGEYASGAIRPTLQATPVRGLLLAAKALVIAPVLLLTGTVLTVVAALTTGLLLDEVRLFNAVTVSYPATGIGLAALRVGVFLAASGLLALGIGTAVRSAATTLTVLFLLLFGAPLLLAMTGVRALVDLSMRLPMMAGLAFLDGAQNLTGAPIGYGPVEGLCWLCGWVAAALAAGWLVLRRRDA